MKTYLTKAELKLMEVIWEKGQIPSNKLVKECLERFNWKNSTTYTNLKFSLLPHRLIPITFLI